MSGEAHGTPGLPQYGRSSRLGSVKSLRAEKEGVRRTVERAAYDEMLAVFPTAADQWKRYADLELAAGSVTAAKAIFAQCLVQCFTVGLFQSYIRFIRAVHEPKGPDGLVQVRPATTQLRVLPDHPRAQP